MSKSNKSLQHRKPKSFTPLRKTITKKFTKAKQMLTKGLKKLITKKNHLVQHLKLANSFSTASNERWIQLPVLESSSQPVFTTRIMTFNILANANIYADLYPHVDPEYLEWKYREPLIVQQIVDMNPDIACLQEFEPALSLTMLESLTSQGYMFEYKEKTGDRTEGCVTFWKSDKFELVSKFHIDMNFSGKLSQMKFMDRDTIAQILVLKSKTSDHSFIIANTHLLYNLKRGEIKLGHILVLLKSINAVAASCDRAGLKTKNTFICGDFNSIPNSLLYNIFTDEKFNLSNIPSTQVSNQLYAKWLKVDDELKHSVESTRKYFLSQKSKSGQYQTLDPEIASTLKNLEADLTEEDGSFAYKIKSAIKDPKKLAQTKMISKEDFGLPNSIFESTYAFVNKHYYAQNPTDKSTNVNRMIHLAKEQIPGFDPYKLTFEGGISHMSSDFQANVDYLWFNKLNKLRPYRILELPGYQMLQKIKSIPNEDHPSDHFALVADFYEHESS